MHDSLRLLCLSGLKVFSHYPFHLHGQGWLLSLFHQNITGDMVQDLMAASIIRVSETSAPVNLLRGWRTWYNCSMTLILAALGLRCHIPLSVASVIQTGCCWLRKRSSVLCVDLHRVTTSWIRFMDSVACWGQLALSQFSPSLPALEPVDGRPWLLCHHSEFKLWVKHPDLGSLHGMKVGS